MNPTTALLAWDLRRGGGGNIDERRIVALRGVARSPGEGLIASITGGRDFLLADSLSGSFLRRFEPTGEDWGDVCCLAIAPDGKTIASGGFAKRIDVWDIPSGSRLFSLGRTNNFEESAGHVDAVLTLAFSPDGYLLLSGSQDSTLRVWDLKSKTCRNVLGRLFSSNSLKGHWMPVVDVALSPDGRQAASAGLEGLIHVWDLIYGASHIRLGDDSDGNGGIGVNAIAFTLDGRFLVAGLADRTMRVWDCRDGELVAVHTTPDVVIALRCLTPDGQIICSNKEHRAWIVELRNVDLGSPIVTAGLQWMPNYDSWKSSNQSENFRPRFGSHDRVAGLQETSPAFWCPLLSAPITTGAGRVELHSEN